MKPPGKEDVYSPGISNLKATGERSNMRNPITQIY